MSNKLWITILVLLTANYSLLATSLNAQESITITTYYPSPYGSYNELQLFPHATAVTPCNATTRGTMYYDSDDGFIHVCDGIGNWPTTGGDWALTGNAGTSTANNFIGTTDNVDLVIRTNNTEKVRVLSGGNVGIGITNPSARLEVRAGSEGQAGPVEAIRIWGPNNPTNANSAQDLKWDFAAAGSTGIRGYRDSSWGTHLQFLTNAQGQGSDTPQIRMHISENGNVGIGTTAPASRLDIGGASFWWNGITFSRDIGNGYWMSYFEDRDGILETTDRFSLGGGTTAGTNEFLTLNWNGNVGIGTINPTRNFDVNGEARLMKASNPINFTDAWEGTPDAVTNVSEISNDTVAYRTLMIIGNRSGGLGRRVSVWDRFEVNGLAFSTTGNWSGSDMRWKKNIENLSDDTLSKVLKLRGVRFEWRKEDFKDKSFSDGKQIGVIAQEIEKDFPELISEDADGYKSFAYDKFTVVLLEAIKAQQKEIEQLKENTDKLQKIISGLQK